MLVLFRGSLKSPWSRRRRKHALLPKQWKNLFAPDGRVSDGGVKFLKKVRSGVCYILLKIDSYFSSDYFYIHCSCLLLVSVIVILEILFISSWVQGVDPSIRAEVWPFLLGV